MSKPDGEEARTEGHELRADGDREDDEVEDVDHLEVRVRALGDEDRAGVEEDGLGEVDERAREPKADALEERAADAGRERAVRRGAEVGLEDVLEAHRADAADVGDHLDSWSATRAKPNETGMRTS
jgi:hypothetical protein